jgi:hypothetical protein
MSLTQRERESLVKHLTRVYGADADIDGMVADIEAGNYEARRPFSPEFGVKRISERVVDDTERWIAEGGGAFIFMGMSRPKPKE